VALAAEEIRLLEGDQVPACEPEHVPVVGIVAVKAPPLLGGVSEALLGGRE
jgi:hypothetical protein